MALQLYRSWLESLEFAAIQPPSYGLDAVPLVLKQPSKLAFSRPTVACNGVCDNVLYKFTMDTDITQWSP